MASDHRTRTAIAREVRREWPALVMVLALCAGVWLAIELTDEVVEGTTRRFDRAVLLAFRTQAGDPLGPSWLQEMMRDFTSLGGIGILTFVTLAIVGYELLERRWRLALTVVVAVLGGVAFSTLIKRLVDRDRPEVVSHAVEVSSASFPSGHSMMAATVYLTLAALLIRFRSRRATEVYVLAAAVAATGVVGLSRVYLGVHWPTDVIAGWTIGAAWALLVWLVAAFIERRGQLLDDLRRERAQASRPPQG